ncbi:amino acid permease [Salmonella enterica subsp. enterica]|uniref:Amino acid permease n=1 Tax=Salmonella enterica I TaxID=59201 RepID=A0A447TZ08_SALET|nr:amino acid permease [Salmonella enterica subsp. enterica]
MGHSDWHPTLKTDGMWFPHGWEQIVVCMTIVIYSFQGVELVGNAAGETESPHIILPKVILGIGLRIILFYGLAIAVLALVYPHELTPNGQSPFVWVFSHAGIPGADTLMTLVIFFRRGFLPLTRPFTPVRVCCGLWRAIALRQPALVKRTAAACRCMLF